MLTDDAIEKIELRVESAFNPSRYVAGVFDYKESCASRFSTRTKK
jgi:hypothetical protein